jgi:hypothetical protein
MYLQGVPMIEAVGITILKAASGKSKYVQSTEGFLPISG